MLDTYDYDMNPDLYRARAKKMRELAKDALDEFMRTELLGLAAQFDALAETKRKPPAEATRAPPLVAQWARGRLF